MKKIMNWKLPLVLILSAVVLFGFKADNESKKYKCMLQIVNYSGEGAYIIVGLINPEGEYEEVLSVIGDDEEWYEDLPDFWKFYKKAKPEIDGITGATMSGGDRGVVVLEIENSKIDAGYKLRFETAVEDLDYHKKDIEMDLTSTSVTMKTEGTGYIRYIRMMPQ